MPNFRDYTIWSALLCDLLFSFSIFWIFSNSLSFAHHREKLFKIGYFFRVVVAFKLNCIELNGWVWAFIKCVPSLLFVFVFLCVLFDSATNPRRTRESRKCFRSIIIFFDFVSFLSLAFFRCFSFDFMSNCSFLHAPVLHTRSLTHARKVYVCACECVLLRVCVCVCGLW